MTSPEVPGCPNDPIENLCHLHASEACTTSVTTLLSPRSFNHIVDGPGTPSRHQTLTIMAGSINSDGDAAASKPAQSPADGLQEPEADCAPETTAAAPADAANEDST